MSNWKEVTLKDISTISGEYGIGASATDYNPDKPRYLRITDIDDNGRLNFTDIKGFEGEDYSQYILHENDIVFARTGNTTGKNYIYNSTDGELVFAGFLVRFRINPLIANSRFIKYCVNTKQYWDWVKINSQRSGQPGINGKEYGKYSFSIPPLKEQQKIAEILSSVDAAIEKTEQVIAKTEEIKKGLMQQLLTKGIGHTEFKQTELGEIPVEWEIKNLVEVAVLTMGQSPSSEDCNEDGQGLVFFQGCSEFGDKYPIPKKYCTNPRKRASKGDILISVRAPVGDLNIAHIECAIGRGLAAIDPINIDRDYLFYYFKLYKDQWQRIQQGSTFSAINKNDLESVLVPCPPKDEQMLIVSKLLTLDKKLEIETEQLDSLQILKKGLMQQLLTGQVRVKVD